MKKQFFRVKQLADQTFSRAGKTEVLSDDLQGAERRIEFIRSVCQSTGKKLAVPGVAADPSSREKRLKKNSDYLLGSSMVESASGEEERLLREVVTDCGKLLMCLATTFVENEIKVESNVVSPLLNISDNEYPNIMKQKKNLTKLILDMDSARARYQTAVKHQNSSSAGSKADAIRDELEEAETKVEQCRDALACDMLQLIARESEVSSTILEYARLQRTYHAAATAILDEIIPEMETAINDSSCRPVFGKPLEEHLQVTERKVAYPVELCVCCILELGIAEEGLFRITAGASKVRRVKLSLDANCLDFETALQYRDPHIFTGVLKSYLRELPQPLLTHELYEQWMAAARILSTGNTDEGLTSMWTVVKSLPPCNLNNLQYLIKFFASLASNKQSNKMSTQNLAIVIAPNLIWGPSEDPNSIGLNMNTANLQSIIVDTLISYADWFFPGEIDFYLTLPRNVLGGLVNGHLGEDQPDITVAAAGDMKRTQSNSSLSDQHSPPQGSPKPAVRVRRQKSAAPNPPISKEMRNSLIKDERGKDHRGSREINREDMIKETAETPVKESAKESNDTVSPKSSKLKRHESLKEGMETSQYRESYSIGFENYNVDKSGQEQWSPKVIVGGQLNRMTSKSGEDLHKGKAQELYSTLERRKPLSVKPVPAPRSNIEVKPSIPQRPANLPRPHSSSFRISRNLEAVDTSPDGETNLENSNVCLERTHMYSVDKQQVAIVQVNNDKTNSDNKSVGEKKECVEKPEKPKKPEMLGATSGHQRAASEGSIIDPGGERRPPRPMPPPPPTPAKRDSTDL